MKTRHKSNETENRETNDNSCSITSSASDGAVNIGDTAGNNSSDEDISSSSTKEHSNSIQKLYEKYEKLNQVEEVFGKEYAKLVTEERLLRKAIQESQETGKEKMIREKREREEEAIHRLEEALLMDDSSSSSSSSSVEGNGNDEIENMVNEK